jgi:hypothetical protein
MKDCKSSVLTAGTLLQSNRLVAPRLQREMRELDESPRQSRAERLETLVMN